MRLKGPSIFIAQGLGKEGWKNLRECAATAASLGYKGLQVPLWNGGPIDLAKAAKSKDYCDEQQGIATEAGCPIVELANHCDTQLVRCTTPYGRLHRWPAPAHIEGVRALGEWAQQRAKMSATAARNFGLDRFAAFSGSSMFHLVYPWPQRPAGLVEAAFNALADAWMPVFEHADELGVDVCFELHPGEDLMDGSTFSRFLPYVNEHPRCKILLDLSHMALAGMRNDNMLDFIRNHQDRIGMFHVKDGEFNPNADGGVYGGYNNWADRPGRFRSLGDGQIDYSSVFGLLKQLDLDLWATLEWECCVKGWKQGSREGAQYIQAWIDGTQQPARTEAEEHSDGAFDDFAKANVDTKLLAWILGIPESEVNTEAPEPVSA